MIMADMKPISFDIETTGLDCDDQITVAGFSGEMASWLAINTSGRELDQKRVKDDIEYQTGEPITLVVADDEAELLEAIREFATEGLDTDSQYICAHNGEVWKGGFDLPFLRTSCVQQDVEWPFRDHAYCDTMDMVDMFDLEDSTLETAYDELIGLDHCDPFDDSLSAVKAWEDGNWTDLLLHNMADIQRTRALAVLAGDYVPRSDFSMKSLSPP